MEMKRPLGTSEGAILEQWAGEGCGGRGGSGEDQVEVLKKSIAQVKMEKITILF